MPVAPANFPTEVSIGKDMLTPDRLMRLMIEIVFILLGGLVVWLGITGHIFFDRRSVAWMVLSVALILWGARALYKPAAGMSHIETMARGFSLLALGTIMVVIARAPFAWVGHLLAAGGVALALRGIFGAATIFQPR